MYDITVFGATGFTGQLTADYLASRRNEEDFKLAIAGRNRGKLQSIKHHLEKKYPSSEITVLHGDITEEPSIRKITEESKVLINTVGPYLQYGEQVVRACAMNGTDYLDITGEGGFLEAMRGKYDTVAKQNASRIIHCCGYDSIPADMGTFFTVKQLPANERKSVECFVKTISRDTYSAFQSISGGTWHSALGFLSPEEFERQQKIYSELKESSYPREILPMPMEFRYREATREFGIPMPVVDTEIVLRSASNLPFYGNSFTYGHFLALEGISQFFLGIFGILALLGAVQMPILKDILYSLKSSGDGPDEKLRESNRFVHSFIGTSATKTIRTEVRGKDPGYGDTSKMLGEAAICCLNDPLPEVYGQVSTATAMGDMLLERLKKNAGLEFVTLD